MTNQPEQFSSVCRYGHVWEATTISSVRRCTSGHCKAIQRMQNGQWVTITPESRVRRQAQAEQATLF